MADTLRTVLGPYIAIPAAFLDRCHDPHAIHLYLYLTKHANKKRVAWPGQERLAKAMATSVSTVQRALLELVACKALETRRRRNKAGQLAGNEYVLLALSHTSRVKAGPHVTGEPHHTSPVKALELDPVELDPRTASDLQNMKHPHRFPMYFCGEFIACVSSEQHFKFEQRVKSAGLDPAEFDWTAWYRERDAEWGELDLMAPERAKSSTFWLAVRLGEDVEALRRTA